jgi:HEAT repeat protein
VPNLIKALGQGDKTTRLEAAKALGDLEAEAAPAAPALARMSRDPDVDVRWRAVKTLGMIHADPKISLPVFRAALQDKDWGMRMTGLEALGQQSPTCQQAVDDLDGALGSDYKDVREEAAVALLRVRPQHEKALQVLKQRLEEKDGGRTFIIHKLTGLGVAAKPLLPALIACLKDNYGAVRMVAAEVLGDWQISPTVTVPALAGALKDDNDDVRTFAAQSLRKFGVKARMAVPALIEVIKKDKNDVCRGAATQALGEIAPPVPASSPDLAALLSDKNPDIRLFAAQSLGQIGAGAKETAPALAELAKKDADHNVRLTAINALLGIGNASKVGYRECIQGCHPDPEGIAARSRQRSSPGCSRRIEEARREGRTE